MSYITNNPKRVITGLATVLAAAGVAVGSGATFTSQTANPENTFTAGTLKQTNSKNGAAIVTGANLKPGDVKTGEVTITNTGTLAGKFTLSEKLATNAFATDSLTVKIVDKADSKVVFDNDLGGVPAAGIALGTFAPSEAHTYAFTVTLSKDAGDADQGKSATATYQWDAVSE